MPYDGVGATACRVVSRATRPDLTANMTAVMSAHVALEPTAGRADATARRVGSRSAALTDWILKPS